MQYTIVFGTVGTVVKVVFKMVVETVVEGQRNGCVIDIF